WECPWDWCWAFAAACARQRPIFVQLDARRMTDCQTPRHPAKSATYRYYSFAINNGPPPGASSAELVKFCQQNDATILWGAWLQAIGPVLIVLFAFALVPLGWSDAAPGGLDDLF